MSVTGWLPRVLASKGIFYGWAVVGVIFLTMLSTSAVMGMTAIVMLPLKNEFGWDLGAISGALGIRFLVYGSVAPFTAAILQRYGVRTVVSSALFLTVVSLAITSQLTVLWQLWLTWGVLVGLATGVTANVLGATIATRWFSAKRGLVVGLLSASNATGQLLFLPLAAWLANVAGWRYAMAPGAVLCLACFVLVILVVRDQPADLDLPPYGETRVVPATPLHSQQNALAASFSCLAAVASNRTFLILAGTFFVCGLSTSGLVQNHFVSLCSDFGIPSMTASSILAMMGGFNFVGTILSGWLADRYDNRWLLFWYYGLRGLSLLALPYTEFSLYGLSIFAIFYGLDWIATIPPTVRLTNDEVGRERGPVAFGWVFLLPPTGFGDRGVRRGSHQGSAADLPAGLHCRRSRLPRCRCCYSRRWQAGKASVCVNGLWLVDVGPLRVEIGASLPPSRPQPRPRGRVARPCSRCHAELVSCTCRLSPSTTSLRARAGSLPGSACRVVGVVDALDAVRVGYRRTEDREAFAAKRMPRFAGR